VKIVAYPHVLELGGSQLNAIELAAGVRDLGHEVIVFGQPGALEHRIGELGLEFVAAPKPRGRPSPNVMSALADLVRTRGIDVVHGYEWTTAVEAYWGARFRLGVPAVATVMSMAVAPFIPRDMPLVVGTEQIADHERRLGRSAVSVIEPPVDVAHNAPGAADPEAFRREFDLDPEALTVVCVTRLAAELKLEGVEAAIDAVASLRPAVPLQLVIVGDGAMREALEARAAEANARAGARAVVLTGELRDPRPAYAAADVCLGMGGSALRAMAFGKPLIVQGEQGFWELMTPQTLDQFTWTGMYGVGPGAAHGADRLAGLLRGLAADPARRAELGAFSRRTVVDRFSLARAARKQTDLYAQAVAQRRACPLRRWTTTGAASMLQLTAYRTKRKVGRTLRLASLDDFNSKPVAAIGAGRPR
jgi:glycosyltransferase involved in cell wall biosynthesis